MMANKKDHIAGSRTGEPLQVVELDKAVWDQLLRHTKKGLALDWVLIGKSQTGLGNQRVSVATVQPDMLIRSLGL